MNGIVQSLTRAVLDPRFVNALLSPVRDKTGTRLVMNGDKQSLTRAVLDPRFVNALLSPVRDSQAPPQNTCVTSVL